MAKINIEFDGKIYSVDENTLAPLASPLERALIQQLAGTGAVIKLGGTNYNVDANKLASARNVLTDHFSNVAGTDSKVTVNGVEHGLSKTKLQNATDKMNETLDGMSVIHVDPEEPDAPPEPVLPASEGLEFELNEDGVSYSVIGIGTCTDTDIVIPDTYEGLPVTALKPRKILVEDYWGSHFEDEGTFKSCTSITSVTIPDSVTSIGKSAFENCTSLMSVTIGNSVTSIGDYAFNYCYKLVEVINKSSLNIEKGSDSNGKVAYYALDVHNGESKIVNKDGYLFYTYEGVNYLVNYVGTDTELTLPANYNGENYVINQNAFMDNDKIISVIIPDSVTSIGEGAFNYCDSLKYNEYNNGKYLGNSKNPYVVLVGVIDTSATSFTIPDTTKIIYDSAFERCNSLTSVTIPDSVTSIGHQAFYYCTRLTSVTIGNSVTSIDNDAFAYCGSLASITIPDSVTSIGNQAFYGCSSLTSVTIPDSVTSIGHSAFRGCTSLTSVTIPDSVTSINRYMFEGCKKLTSVTIPDSVTSIGERAFSNCGSLTSVTIPNSVTSIDSYAFDGCTKLTSITIPDSVTSIGWNAFDNTGYYNNELNWENDVLYIGKYLIEAKDTVSGAYTIKSGTKCISSYAFSNCGSLTSVTIPDSVTSIDDSAFYYCSNLTSVTIGNSVTSIGYSAFSGCTSLIDIYINKPEGSISLGIMWCPSTTTIHWNSTGPEN